METSHFRRPSEALYTELIACPVAGGEGMPGGMAKEAGGWGEKEKKLK